MQWQDMKTKLQMDYNNTTTVMLVICAWGGLCGNGYVDVLDDVMLAGVYINKKSIRILHRPRVRFRDVSNGLTTSWLLQWI